VKQYKIAFEKKRSWGISPQGREYETKKDAFEFNGCRKWMTIKKESKEVRKRKDFSGTPKNTR
jgi:hypothetical protein